MLKWYKEQIKELLILSNIYDDIWIEWNSNAIWLDKNICLPNFKVYKRISKYGYNLVCKVRIQLEIKEKEISKIMLHTDNCNDSIYITSNNDNLFIQIEILMYKSFENTIKFLID